MFLVDHASSSEAHVKIVYFGGMTGERHVNVVCSRVSPSEATPRRVHGDGALFSREAELVLFSYLPPTRVGSPLPVFWRLHLFAFAGAGLPGPADLAYLLKGADGVVLVVDPSSGTQDSMRARRALLRDMFASPVPTVYAVERGSEGEGSLFVDELRGLLAIGDAPVFEVDSGSGAKVMDVFGSVARLAMSVRQGKRIRTGDRFPSRIEDVPWAMLRHAYGEALDVPALLGSLTSPDADARRAARESLYSNLCHQGTRYPASPYAIPFLVRLLKDESTPDRSRVLGMITRLVTGELNVRVGPFVDLPCHDVAGEGGEVYLRLLADADPQLRAAAAHLLSVFSEEPGVGAALRARFDVEVDPVARATLAVSQGEFLKSDSDGPASAEALTAWLGSDASPLVRFACALALVRGCLEDAPPNAVETLSAAAEKGSDVELWTESPWASAHAQSDAATVLARLSPARIRPLLAPFCAALESARSFDVEALLDLLLSVFPEMPQAPLQSSGVDDDQRRVLRAMIGSDGVWDGVANIAYSLVSVGLPLERQKMVKLLDREAIEPDVGYMLRKADSLFWDGGRPLRGLHLYLLAGDAEEATLVARVEVPPPALSVALVGLGVSALATLSPSKIVEGPDLEAGDWVRVRVVHIDPETGAVSVVVVDRLSIEEVQATPQSWVARAVR